jgi:hypothetical protein
MCAADSTHLNLQPPDHLLLHTSNRIFSFQYHRFLHRKHEILKWHDKRFLNLSNNNAAHVFVNFLGIAVLAKQTPQHTHAAQPQHLEHGKNHYRKSVSSMFNTLIKKRSDGGVR